MAKGRFKRPPMKPVGKGKKAPVANEANEYEDDEVDQFMKQRSKVTLEDAAPEESEDEENVETLYDLPESGSEEEEGDEEDEGEDEEEDGEGEDDGSEDEEDVGEDDSISQKWGKKKKLFYGENDYQKAEDEEEAEQLAKEEEAEAIKLQKKRLQTLSAEDFLGADPSSFASRLQGPKAAEAKQAGKQAAGKAGKAQAAAAPAKAAENLDNIDIDDIIAGTGGSTAGAGAGAGVEVERIVRDTTGMSREEKLELLMTEAPELLKLLEELKEKAGEVKERVQPLLARVQNGEIPTDQGVSYLEVKLHLLLSYCIHVVFYLLLKANGKPVRNHPVIEQLVKLRVLLEKLRPLDRKLKNQVDRLLKMAAAGRSVLDPNDPRSFRANPDNFISQAGEKQAKAAKAGKKGKESQEDEAAEDAGVYRPPVIAEAAFEDKADKEAKKKERAKKRAAKSSMAQFLEEEFGDKPEEVSMAAVTEDHEDEEERQRREYEEEMYVRLTQSKKELAKQKKKKQQRIDDGLEDFADFAELDAIDKRKQKAQELRDAIQGSEKPPVSSGDADLPYRDPEQQRQRKRKAQEEEENGHTGNINQYAGSDESEIEDDAYYTAVKNANARKKQKTPRAYVEETAGGGKRKITNAIASNRGLTRSRPKEQKNPRKRMRMRYENALAKRRGQVRGTADTSAPYGGERTGIKKNVVKSTKLSGV